MANNSIQYIQYLRDNTYTRVCLFLFLRVISKYVFFVEGPRVYYFSKSKQSVQREYDGRGRGGGEEVGGDKGGGGSKGGGEMMTNVGLGRRKGRLMQEEWSREEGMGMGRRNGGGKEEW